jgi:AbrB family looped-hinge helix DNA binding protein
MRPLGIALPFRTGVQEILTPPQVDQGARRHAARRGGSHTSIDHANSDERTYGDRYWEFGGNIIPMQAVVDSVGRVLVPKALRDALGLRPGTAVDISRYGNGLQIIPGGRTARLVDEGGVLVATGETTIDDDVVFRLIDAGRR